MAYYRMIKHELVSQKEYGRRIGRGEGEGGERGERGVGKGRWRDKGKWSRKDKKRWMDGWRSAEDGLEWILTVKIEEKKVKQEYDASNVGNTLFPNDVAI
jgi:hypothetical protein